MAEKNDKKGNMTFADIRIMFENGLMGISSRSLDLAHAYKVVSFKTKLKNAYNEYNDRREQLAKDCGIEDGNSFAKRMNQLASIVERTEAEDKEFKEMVAKNEQFNGMFEKLMADTYEIEPKVMPYEEWRKLQEENKEVKIGKFELLAQFEISLEGILWKAPEGVE